MFSTTDALPLFSLDCLQARDTNFTTLHPPPYSENPRCHTRCRSSGVEPASRLILVKPPHTWISPLPRDELLKLVIQISKRTVQKYLTEVSQSSPQAVRPGPAAGAGRSLHDRHQWQVHLERQIVLKGIESDGWGSSQSAISCCGWPSRSQYPRR
jgi:hypothetical protein